jgi:hypothetical protein
MKEGAYAAVCVCDFFSASKGCRFFAFVIELDGLLEGELEEGPGEKESA